MLNEALLLADKGFRVIPCNGKIPLIKKWQINATNNSDKIKELWNSHEYNIGILTGASDNNLVVIDCDVKDEVNGTNNFLEFLKNENIDLPNTLTATSGRGGKHYYFRSKSTNIKTGTNVIDTGIDIRANGGFIIAPPSLHANGNHYMWDNDFAIAELPQLLENKLLQDNKSDKPKVPKEKSVRKIDIKRYDEIANIEVGERNDTLFRLASKLIDSGLCKNAILDAINAENENKCIVPLTREEVKSLVDSSLKYRSEDKKHTGSIMKIFNGKYTTTSIAIYWCIWYLSLNTLKDRIYISQIDLCKMLGIKTRKTLRDNTIPLAEDDLIDIERTPCSNKGYGVNSYKIL